MRWNLPEALRCAKRRWRGWVCVLPLWAFLALAGSARAADTERIKRHLRVEPGATCVSLARLATEIEQLLGDSTIADDLVIFVEGSATDPRGVYLRFVRHEGVVATRAFERGPERCSHLHAAVALAITFAINAENERKPELIRDWSLAVMGLWTYRLLPRFAPGAELSARRTFGEHVLLRAGVLGVFADGARVEAVPGTFDAMLIAARIEGCGRLALLSRLRTGVCVGMLGGMLHASGDDVPVRRSATVPWLALSAALDVELGLADRWSLLFGVSTTVLLHRVRIGFENASGAPGRNGELERVALALGVGLLFYL